MMPETEILNDPETAPPRPFTSIGNAAMLMVINNRTVPFQYVPIASWLVIRALKSARAEIRLKAANILAEMKSRRAVAFLAEALGDESNTVRLAAARALGSIGDPLALRALMSAADLNRHPAVRAEAIASIGRIGHPAAAGFLAELIRAGRDVAHAIEALAALLEACLGLVSSDDLNIIMSIENTSLPPAYLNGLPAPSPAERTWMRLQKIVMREARRRNLRGIGAASGGYRPEYNRAPAGEKAEVYA